MTVNRKYILTIIFLMNLCFFYESSAQKNTIAIISSASGKIKSDSLESIFTLGQTSAIGFSRSFNFQNVGGQLFSTSILPPAPSITSIAVDSGRITLFWEKLTDKSIKSVLIYRSTGIDSSNTAKILLNELDVSDTTYSDLEVLNGTTYWYTLQSKSGENRKSKKFSIKSFVYPDKITLYKKIKFNPDYKMTESYQIISLPGNNDMLGVEKTFRGSAGPKGSYRIFWDTGQDADRWQDYLIEYTASEPIDTFNFIPGRAFIALSKIDWPSDTILETDKVDAVKLSNNNSYPIPLHNGWNLISNPFESTISWTSINEANKALFNVENIQCFMHFDTKNRKYESSDLFVPFTGYYFYNDCSKNRLCPTSLLIPYIPVYSNDIQPSTCTVNTDSTETSALISFIITTENGSQSNAMMVHNKYASSEFDQFDILYPETSAEKQAIFFTNKKKSNNRNDKFIRDTRPLDNEENSKNIFLEVKIPNNSSAILQAKGSYLSSGYDVSLIDLSSYDIFDLRKQIPFQIILNKPHNMFELVLEKIDEDEEFTFPDDDSSNLYAEHFPNPMKSNATFKIGTKNPIVLSLEIYDILGRKIVTLFENKFFQKGWHKIHFNPSRLQSGMYIYKIYSKKIMITKKIIVVS